MTTLTELKKLAEASTDGNCWYAWEVMVDDGYDVDDSKFIAAAAPATILSILAVMEMMGKAVRGAYMKDLHDDALLTELADALAAYNKLLNGGE